MHEGSQSCFRLTEIFITSEPEWLICYIYRISIFLMVVSDRQKLSKSLYLAKLQYTNAYNIPNGAHMNLSYTVPKFNRSFCELFLQVCSTNFHLAVWTVPRKDNRVVQVYIFLKIQILVHILNTAFVKEGKFSCIKVRIHIQLV